MAIEDFGAANLAIMRAYPAAVAALGDDAEAVDKFNKAAAAVVAPERVSQFFEFIYARRDVMPAEVLETAADVGQFATRHGFYGLGADNRGFRMERILRGESLPEEQVPETAVAYRETTTAATAAPE